MKKTLLLPVVLAIFGCESFDPAPSAELAGERNGVIASAAANPLIVRFSAPIVASSLSLAVVPDLRDSEGNLLDEQEPPKRDEYLASRLFAFERGNPGDDRATYTLEKSELLVIAPHAGNELDGSPLGTRYTMPPD